MESIVAKTLKRKAAPKPRTTFAVENFMATAREAMPLIKRHEAEVGLDKMPWKFRPKFTQIGKACDAGIGVWIVARNPEGAMIGYALFFVTPSLMFQDLTQAWCESIYVVPEERTKGLSRTPPPVAFIRFCEEELARRGANLVAMHIWTDTGFWPLLQHLGYVRKQETWWHSL